jgi:hypothetical protein
MSENTVPGHIVDPAVPVPSDAFRITEDMAVSDNMVAVAPDGTVIDSRGAGTIISTADGLQVLVNPDGTMVVDRDFRTDAAADIANLDTNDEFVQSGNTVLTDQFGNAVITQSDGQKITVYPNGTFSVDLPDGTTPVAPPTSPIVPTSPPTGGAGTGAAGLTGSGGAGSGGAQPSGTSTGQQGGNGERTPGDSGEQGAGTPTGKGGNDIRVTPTDLESDAAYYSARAADAAVLARCFDSLSTSIVEWGLWYSAQGPFTQACGAFAEHMAQGNRRITEMADGLRDTAAEYRKSEQTGEELANEIF